MEEGEILTMKALIVGACLLVSSVAWAAPTLTVNGTSGPITVSGGTTVTLVVQNGPGTVSDCVTLDFADFHGFDGTHHQFFAWVTGNTMTVSFPMPTVSGVYATHYWQNCSTQIAVSPTVTVQGSGPVSLTVNGSNAAITVSGGATVTLLVQNGSATASDCVTLDFADFHGFDGTHHQFFAWVTGNTMTVSFPMPTVPGVYAARYWQNCSTLIAVSPTVTVQGSGPVSFTVNGSNAAITVSGGATVALLVQNGSATASDCVTLDFADFHGFDGTHHQFFAWVTGNTMTVSFPMPTVPGVYAARYWQNCSTQIAVSPTVTTTPSVAPASVPPANQLPELPRIYVDTTMPTTTATVTACGSGCELQGVVNAANLGDVIELQAGATYPGQIVLPNKTNGTGWIIIRSSAWQSLPPGTRVGPQHAPLMAKITTNPSSPYEPAIVTREGAHHYRFIGIEVTGADPAPNANSGLILIDGSHYDANNVYRLQPTNALTPHHIVIDRCYIHGTPTGEFIRGVLMNGLHIAIVDSYLSNFHSRSSDTQAAIAWNTAGPLKLVNNYLEAAGENVMFGGAASVTAGYIPSDIEIRSNFFDKPLSWRPGDSSYAGIPWLVKNLIEFKDGQRALVEGNVFGHHWAGGQSGFFFVLTPRGEYNQNPWAFTGDITFRYNRILKTTAGLLLSGTDDQVAQKSNRVLVEHNVFENIGAYVVPGAFNGDFTMPSNAIQNLTIRHNSIFQSYMPFHFAGDSIGPMNGFTVVDNIFGNGGYGIMGETTGGVAELDAIAPGWVMRKNAIYGPYPNANGVLQSYYPADDYFPASQDAVGFVNLAVGDYHLAPWSSYKNTGTDGKDVGADIDAVNTATACAISGACGTQ